MEQNHAVGIAAALGSSASWALGTLLFRNLCKDVAPLPLTLGKALISIVLFTAVLAVRGFHPLESDVLRELALSGVIGIAIGDSLFFAALRELKAHMLVGLMMVSPVLTIALAMIFLGE